MFHGLFPTLPIDREIEAESIYHVVFGNTPLSAWSRQGTLLTRFVDGRKLNFAARRTHCTIGFQGHAVIEFYRFIGGKCPVGEVTIKIPYCKDFNSEPVTEAIEWYCNN